MPRQPLGQAAQDLIAQRVDEMFARLKLRYLGPRGMPQDKRIAIVPWTNKDLTLEGVFQQASALEGVRGDEGTLDTIMKLASGYLDAAREHTKSQVLREVTAFLLEAQGAKTKTDLKTVLGGKLSEVMAKVSTQVDTIIDAETATAKNIGLMDGVTRINAHLGIEDAVVYFLVVHDAELCKECQRVHLLEDGVTPRLWLLSEVKQGFHKKGEDSPAIGGLHPHCRCTIATLMPGYGFTAGGLITYKSPDWDELREQRFITKSGTSEGGYPALEKRDTTFKEFASKVAAFGWRPIEAGAHTQFVHDRIKMDRPAPFKRGHRTGKFDAVAADDMYAKPLGLRYNQKTGEVYINPNHPYAAQYRALGMLQDTPGSASAPPPRTWTPANHPHQHVDIGQLRSPGPTEERRTEKWHSQLQDPAASMAVPPISVQKTPEGALNVIKGHHRLAAAKGLGLTHVPITLDNG